MKQAVIWHYAPKPELSLNRWLGRCARANGGPRSTCHLPVTADTRQEGRQSRRSSRLLALTPALQPGASAERGLSWDHPAHLWYLSRSTGPSGQHQEASASLLPGACSGSQTGVNQGLPCCRQWNSSWFTTSYTRGELDLTLQHQCSFLCWKLLNQDM